MLGEVKYNAVRVAKASIVLSCLAGAAWVLFELWPNTVFAAVHLLAIAAALFTGPHSFRRDVPRRLKIAVAVTLTVPVGIIVFYIYAITHMG